MLSGRGAGVKCVLKVVGKECVLWVVVSEMCELLVKGEFVVLGRVVKTLVGRREGVDQGQERGIYFPLPLQHSQPSPTVWSYPLL